MKPILHDNSRKLTPDLARGFMLLFIALAHSHQFIFSTNREITFMDQYIVFIRQVVVDGRAFPLFAILFGYVLHQLMKSIERKGNSWKDFKKMIKQRGAWMLVIGFFHATLFLADIIGVYGLIALLFGSIFLQLSNKYIILLSVFFLILVVVFAPYMPRGFDTLNMEVTNTATIINPIEGSITRMIEWFFYTPILSYQVIPGVLIGILIARLQIIDIPKKNKKILYMTAVLGLLISTVGGIPMALMSSLIWTNYNEVLELIAKSLHTLTGYAGGIGWIALIGLVVIKLEVKSGKLTNAIVALGQRSMSFYLFQSILFVMILAPYAGGFGRNLSQLGSDLIAVFIWILSILVANFMHHKSIRGPFETFLRKKSTIQ